MGIQVISLISLWTIVFQGCPLLFWSLEAGVWPLLSFEIRRRVQMMELSESPKAQLGKSAKSQWGQCDQREKKTKQNLLWFVMKKTGQLQRLKPISA